MTACILGAEKKSPRPPTLRVPAFSESPHHDHKTHIKSHWRQLRLKVTESLGGIERFVPHRWSHGVFDFWVLEADKPQLASRERKSRVEFQESMAEG